VSATSLAGWSQAQWQKKFDGWFPDGVIASWTGHAGPGKPVIYAVPWIQVGAMDGNDPVIVMRPYGTSRVVGPYHVTDYDLLRTKPHNLVMVTFEEASEHMVLAAGMDPRRREQMKPERAVQQARPVPPDMFRKVA
jgi:hypothetical protein